MSVYLEIFGEHQPSAADLRKMEQAKREAAANTDIPMFSDPTFDWSTVRKTAATEAKVQKLYRDALAEDIFGTNDYGTAAQPIKEGVRQPFIKLDATDFDDFVSGFKTFVKGNKNGCECECVSCRNGECKECDAEEKCATCMEQNKAAHGRLRKHINGLAPAMVKFRNNLSYALGRGLSDQLEEDLTRLHVAAAKFVDESVIGQGR